MLDLSWMLQIILLSAFLICKKLAIATLSADFVLLSFKKNNQKNTAF